MELVFVYISLSNVQSFGLTVQCFGRVTESSLQGPLSDTLPLHVRPLNDPTQEPSLPSVPAPSPSSTRLSVNVVLRHTSTLPKVPTDITSVQTEPLLTY